jgi:hypothetical protein
MMRIGIVTVVVALFAAVAAGTSSAAPVTVSLPTCYFAHGGQVTVPAGSDVTVRLGVLYQYRGRTQDFLASQTTTATLNGNPVAGASSLWGAPQAVTGGWVTFWNLSVGTLANPGDSAVMTMQVNLSHQIPAGRDPETGRQLFSGPGDLFPSDFGCRITAV